MPRADPADDVLLPLVKEQVLVTRTEMPAEFQKSLGEHEPLRQRDGESPRKRAAVGRDGGREDPGDGGGESARWTCCGLSSVTTSFYARARTTARPRPSCSTRWGGFRHSGQRGEVRRGLRADDLGVGLFESLAEYNVKLFNKYKFRRLVTGDAHAHNAFHFRYPMYGMTQAAEHTAQFSRGTWTS